MDPISQQLSNADRPQVSRTPADNEGLLPPNEHISYVPHLDFLSILPIKFFSCQLGATAEHLLSQWVECKQRRKRHNQSELFSSPKQKVIQTRPPFLTTKPSRTLREGEGNHREMRWDAMPLLCEASVCSQLLRPTA